MKSYRINHYATFSTLKALIVKHFNITLKELICREFSFNGKYKWIEMYNQLINKYNKRVHKTVKMSPSNVNSSNEKQILQTSYNHLKIFVASKFRKGTTFVLVKINMSLRNKTNLLEDLDGSSIQGGFY